MRVFIPFLALLTAHVATVNGAIQNFDGGGTLYASAQYGTSPGPTVLPGGPTGSFMRLAKEGVGNQANKIAFDRTFVGNSWIKAVLDFDFRIGGPGDGADGFGIAFLNTANFGTTGTAGGFFSEEPNVVNSFGLGIDTWSNGGEGANDVSLHFNGSTKANVGLANMSLENGDQSNIIGWNHARLELVKATGGVNVTVKLTDILDGSIDTPYSNFHIAGFNPYEGRWAFSARTGGADDNHDLDNIVASYEVAGGAVPEPATLTIWCLGALGCAAAAYRRRKAA